MDAAMAARDAGELNRVQGTAAIRSPGPGVVNFATVLFNPSLSPKVNVRVTDPAMPLLYALRNDLGLHGPRFGCGLSLSIAPGRNPGAVAVGSIVVKR
jgi:hypothetical protein